MTAAHTTFSGRSLELFAAAEEAMAQIPPAFPLAATVAVNPYLGQMQEDRALAAQRLARVGGGPIFLPRSDIAAMIAEGRISDLDLEEAARMYAMSPADLRDASASQAPRTEILETVADIAAARTGVDWPALIEDRFGLWASAHFDRGQAFWPAPDIGAYASWRGFASRDLTPGLAGLSGFAERAEALPADARLAFAETCESLDLSPQDAPLYFHRLLVTLAGWAQYARHLDWLATRDGNGDRTLFELLTIRLVWDAALLAQSDAAAQQSWRQARATLARPQSPQSPQEALRIDAALQEAADRAAERQLSLDLAGRPVQAVPQRPEIQAAFCIDVRSEIYRRALESTDTGIATIGFAGFFGLPLAHSDHASDIVEARAPILLRPAVTTTGGGASETDRSDRVRLRAVRAWGRFKRAAVSAFAFVEAAGPLYVGKLIRDSLPSRGSERASPLPRLDLPLDQRIGAAAKILTAMSLTDGFARLVLIAGHGARVTNIPQASALQCGACGGHAGDVNARVLAALLNETSVREGLSQRGIHIPQTTRFVAGLHDTVSDEVQLFDADAPDSHMAELARLRSALNRATGIAGCERAASLPRGDAATLGLRGGDWSELRPEWGLAGCAAFIAAPRSRSAGCDLGGRVFLHDYDWHPDEDSATLELILSAPVVVASWIALQYHGSSVSPDVFGAGNKLLHNVVGGIGVLEGNGGPLRIGLPWQSVHDGDTLRHRPIRLSILVEAPTERISAVLARQPDVRALFDNGWLALLALDSAGQVAHRYERGSWHATPRTADDSRQAA